MGSGLILSNLREGRFPGLGSDATHADSGPGELLAIFTSITFAIAQWKVFALFVVDTQLQTPYTPALKRGLSIHHWWNLWNDSGDDLPRNSESVPLPGTLEPDRGKKAVRRRPRIFTGIGGIQG